MITVRLVGWWATPEEIMKEWVKMSKNDKGMWNNIQLVSSENADYTVILGFPNIPIDLPRNRIIVVHMEPARFNRNLGELSDPNPALFKGVLTHKYIHNIVEWHISPSYTELVDNTVDLRKVFDNEVSVVLSNQYTDPGHKLRIDFAKYLDNNGVIIHHYGKGGNVHNFTHHYGELPRMKKDRAQFPYKYTFNAENHSEHNYVTEKLYDAILSECLCFYWGCPNIANYLDPRAYIVVDLNDFEGSMNTVKSAIANNEWEKRLPYIREAKLKILNEMNFFAVLERTLN